MRKILLLVAFLAGLRANGQMTPVPKDVLQKAYAATVVLIGHTDEGAGVCSATIVCRKDAEYKILSAAHCVGDLDTEISIGEFESESPIETDRSLVVNFGSKFFVSPESVEPDDPSNTEWREDATILAVGNFDAGRDYSVLSFSHTTETPLPVAAIDPDPLEVGDGIFNISNPLNHTKTALFGTVVKVDEDFDLWHHALLLQMPGAAPGSSGSAVFDSEGRIRAIVVGGDGENPSLVVAIPVADALAGNL